MDYVVANMGGVAPNLLTVVLVAKANVGHQPHLPTQLVGVSAAYSASLFSTNCLNIGMMGAVPAEDSTPKMLSSLRPDLLVASAQQVMLTTVRGSLQLSWLKPLMRL
jgi:hypothetical protein